MPDTITRDEAYRKLAARCSTKECCIAEVREKLHNWNIPRKEEESIVEQLVKENFIDEARYCRAFVQDQFRFSGWGRIKIGYTLRQKQIDPLTVSQSMKVIDETEYTDALRRILKSKCRGLKAVDPSLQGDKLMRFAVSRGFEIDLIKKCLRELSLECTVGSEI